MGGMSLTRRGPVFNGRLKFVQVLIWGRIKCYILSLGNVTGVELARLGY